LAASTSVRDADVVNFVGHIEFSFSRLVIRFHPVAVQKALGLTMPRNLIMLADDVIEWDASRVRCGSIVSV
jgi:hypothetical protein